MARFQNKDFIDEHIIIKPEGITSFLSSATFTNCVIDIRESTSNWIATKATFTGCKINFKKKQKNLRLTSAVFRKCVFTGTIDCADFGSKFYESDVGGIIDCDFRDCAIRGGRFFGEDSGMLSFDPNLLPRWPSTYVFSDSCDIDYLKSLTWPKSMGSLIGIWSAWFQGTPLDGLSIPKLDALRAVSCYWPMVTKDDGELDFIQKHFEKAGALL